jgi:DNA-binding beta-propeller fold protein YncE
LLSLRRVRTPGKVRLRSAAGVVVAAVLAALVPVAAAAARSVAVVGNLRAGTVTFIDQGTLSAIGTLDVTPDGKTPHDLIQALLYPVLVTAKGVNYVQGVALSPDGRILYVSRGYLGDVAAFDLSTRRLLWRLQVSGVRADHLALSRDGRRLFISALTANEVQVIDTASHTFVGSFPTGDWAHVLVFTPDDGLIVNGSLGNQLLPGFVPTRFQLTFADPLTLQVKRVLSFDAGVRPFVFSPDGKLAYVQFSYFHGFKVIDTATGHVLATVSLPVAGPAVGQPPSSYPNQAAHHGIDLSGDHTTICDAGTVSNYVALVDRASLHTRAIIPVGDQPADAQTSSDGRLCFVTNRGTGPGGNTVSAISYRDGCEVARIPAGQGPQEITVGAVPDAVLRQAGFTLPAGGSTPAASRCASARRRDAHHHRRARSRQR